MWEKSVASVTWVTSEWTVIGRCFVLVVALAFTITEVLDCAYRLTAHCPIARRQWCWAHSITGNKKQQHCRGVTRRVLPKTLVLTPFTCLEVKTCLDLVTSPS
ncbi:hypothetical protein TRVL_04535 [Trypanosoma vivax]|nr:hypothetical protein TRVL_04535 [Trypanosoma vivax]